MSSQSPDWIIRKLGLAACVYLHRDQPRRDAGLTVGGNLGGDAEVGTEEGFGVRDRVATCWSDNKPC